MVLKSVFVRLFLLFLRSCSFYCFNLNTLYCFVDSNIPQIAFLRASSFCCKVIMLFIFFSILVIMFAFRERLLLVLLLLEILGFVIIYFVAVSLYANVFRDFLVLIIFTVLVIEGVIGLSGLITLVRFSGSDYLKSSSVIKC